MKKGLDFFMFNTNFFEDDKIGLTEGEHSWRGGYIAVRLMCKIYDIEGYFCQWDEDARFLFARKLGCDAKELSAVAETLVKRGFFNAEMYEKYQILTSRAFQRYYASGASRRNVVSIKREYLLIPKNELPRYGNLHIEGDAAGQQAPANAGLPARPGQGNPAPAPKPATTTVAAGAPCATITRKGAKAPARKLNDELRILSDFFFRNFVSPERQLDKFIRHNELSNRNNGGWAKMSTTLRLAACVEWKQLDDNKKPITEMRFKTDEQRAFLDVWKTLFNALAFQYDAPEEILTDMMRDNVKWVPRLEYMGKVQHEYQLGASPALIEYFQNNQSIVEPVLRPLVKGHQLQYVALEQS